MATKIIRTSKYDGFCGWCGGLVKAGEEVGKVRGTLGHVACAKRHRKDQHER